MSIFEFAGKIMRPNLIMFDGNCTGCFVGRKCSESVMEGGIVSNRIDEENKQKEQILREFELQKIRLQNETQRVVGPQTLPQTKIELKKLLPTFNPEVDNMDLFLTLFERQMKLLDLGEDLWVPISLVPYLVM
ncbi:uncharacterized protein TNCV_4110551 [Trichonephila clavipes]|nr:uncharacterized protein TNCV_4110551 [Trichonephila clavipes]